MSLLTGSAGWLSTWPAEQRRRVVDLGRRRRREATAWLAVGVLGVVLAVVTLTAGHPAVTDLPSAAWAMVALAVDAVVLLLCLRGWARTVAIFAGDAPPPTSMAGIRLRTAVPGMAALVMSLIGALFSTISPLVALSRGQFGWAEAATFVAAALAVGCGIAPVRLWVNLLPVQQSALRRS